MTITAKNIGRINVWPTYGMAREADTEESKFVGQMTVWRTPDEARANISHEEEGGGGEGGAPAWVPANAVIHIDLVGGDPQGRAWVEGTGVVAVDTLLGSDPNSEIAFDVTGYDPAFLTASGYGDASGDTPAPAFIGALRTTALADSTVAIKFYEFAGSSDPTITMSSADGNDALEIETSFSAVSRDIYVSSWGGGLDITALNVLNHLAGGGAVSVIACTFDGTRVDMSGNGSAVEAGTLDEFDRPPGNPLAAMFIDLQGQSLQSVTVYDPLPSAAGLPALSQTGVTNTAPTNVHDINWGTEYTNAIGVFVANPGGGGSDIFALTADDPEGNPVTFSLTDDDSGRFYLHNNNHVHLGIMFEAPGGYNFTARATDLGGLYVEQEFTVTVTA